MEEIIPEGKIKLSTGEIVDRADIAFKLRKHPKWEDYYYDSKGQLYHKDSKGTLYKYPPKQKGKKEKIKVDDDNN